MSDTITVTIGGEVIPLPLIMNFATLKRVWPAVRAFSNSTDPIDIVSTAIGFVSALLVTTRPELDVPEIEKRLVVGAKGDEQAALTECVNAILKASGLTRDAAEAGEAPPLEAAAPSAATA